jgi:prevent-host-death family protein
MVTLNEVHPLADFQKNAKGHLRRLNKTGQPEVLTVNGKPAVVVQDARSYQRLLDSVEQAEAIAGIKLGLESLEPGDGVPAKKVFARLRCKHKIPASERNTASSSKRVSLPRLPRLASRESCERSAGRSTI